VHFDFDQDRLLFRDSVRALLADECTPESLRALAASESGRSSALWGKLADMGLLGLRIAEEHGGMGLSEVDFVLPLEETGRAGLPEPVVETAAIAAPLLTALESDARARQLLPEIAAGKAIVTVGHPANAFVADAHIASSLLLARNDELHLVAAPRISIEHEPAIDPLRRLFTVEWSPGAETCIATGAHARSLLAAAFDRGAFATAAQQLGVAERLIETAVAYACTRQQFGQAIGAFQAIKHMLASVAVRIEFARPVVYRAACVLAATADGEASLERAVAASHAKAAASEAATMAAKTALQVHGAIGYTWEVDLHLWMKRAWSLDLAWGSAAYHRARVADLILDGDAPAPSFGFAGRNA
jgi:alkylation response protein AidB-like acyl-CoA dehydrogenase